MIIEIDGNCPDFPPFHDEKNCICRHSHNPILLLLPLLLLVLWSSRVGRGTGQRPGESVLCRDTTRLPATKNQQLWGTKTFFSGENLKFYAPCLNLGWRGLIKMGKVWNCWKHSNCIVLFSSCLFWSRLNVFLWGRDLARYFNTHNPSHSCTIRGTFLRAARHNGTA